MATKTGQGLVNFAKSKVGTPYFYGLKMQKLTEKIMSDMHKAYPSTVTAAYMNKARVKKMVGKVCVDCSGLISAYTGHALGSSQLYAQAYTRLKMSTYKDWANGVVVWRKGHVGVFLKENGKYYVYEAKGIDYGTVRSTFDKSKWTCGLTFKWMTYNYSNNVVDSATWKGSNPYESYKPSGVVTSTSQAKVKGIKSYTSSGNEVKWVQWELCQAGFSKKIEAAGGIDGKCGDTTVECIKLYQKSAKLTVDGLCGSATIKSLSAN